MKKKKKKCFVFRGTLMEGPEINLIELAGLKLTDAQEDRLWCNTNRRDLLLECFSCEELLLKETDDIPGLSDSYYEYRCEDRAELADELRERILERLPTKAETTVSRIWMRVWSKNENDADYGCDIAWVDMTPEYVSYILKFHDEFMKLRDAIPYVYQVEASPPRKMYAGVGLLVDAYDAKGQRFYLADDIYADLSNDSTWVCDEEWPEEARKVAARIDEDDMLRTACDRLRISEDGVRWVATSKDGEFEFETAHLVIEDVRKLAK